ncbi:type II secretion system F family protein [Thermovibrio sp.]
MAVYKYVGRDVLDRRRKGIIEAESLELAKEMLLDRGVVVIEKLQEDRSIFKKNLEIPFLKRISLKDVLIFTRQLYAMIHAGIPLVQALRVIKEQLPNKALREIVEEMASFIEEGGKLSTALSRYRDVFGDLYISMIRAAEEAGTLEETLKRLADYLEKVEKLRGKVKSAMFYPVFVLIVATIIITGILVFVIPTFQKLYEDLGGQLPGLTQAVINLSQWLRDNIGWFFLFIVVGVIAFIQARRIKKFKYITDYALLRTPVFGELILKSSIANFARTFSSMLASGINILNALEIAAETSNNEVIKEAILEIKKQVEKGVSLSAAMSKQHIFPPMLKNMVAIGEQAGNLDEMLSKVADFYEEEVDRTVDGLTSLIEPLLIVFIGGIIGVIIIAMYLPIFKIGELIK